MQIMVLDPVETFIESILNEKEAAKTIHVIELLEEFEHKLGMPHSKHIEKGIFELRIRGKREIRILYCFYKNKIFLLNAFIKKTQVIPIKEIIKAKKSKISLHYYNL